MPLAFVCKTCKTDYYCGYGGGGSYEHRKNKFPTHEHEGHDYFEYCSDFTNTKGGHLWQEWYLAGDDTILVENYKDYKQVDLTKPDE